MTMLDQKLFWPERETKVCSINPKQRKHFVLSVYTSRDMTEQEFDKLVLDKAVELETSLNADMRLRWHIKESS